MGRSLVSAVLGWSLCLVSCNGSTGDDCHHSCPLGSFVVTVPQDRLNDVASVQATGPCAQETVTGSAPQFFYFGVNGEGVCRITVSFRSGVPDFVKDVQSAKPHEGCCPNVAYPQEGNVTVPESVRVDGSAHD